MCINVVLIYLIIDCKLLEGSDAHHVAEEDITAVVSQVRYIYVTIMYIYIVYSICILKEVIIQVCIN